jgi:hypothetical protein
MPDQDRISDLQGVENRYDVISERPGVITRLRRGGLAKPAPRNLNDVIMCRELRP